jgi:hypothetical protein
MLCERWQQRLGRKEIDDREKRHDGYERQAEQARALDLRILDHECGSVMHDVTSKVRVDRK